MKEIDYIKATNLAKLRMAASILKDVLPAKHYGISLGQYGAIMKPLLDAEEELNKTIECTEE